jgi:hypothetical protein
MDIDLEIENLKTITDWTEKLKKIKTISKNIQKEEKKLDKLLDSLENNVDNTISQSKNLDISHLIDKFNNENDLNNNIKLYKQICQYIDRIENEIFAK